MSGLITAVGNLGDSLSRFTQRWIPDSWVVCMILTVVAILLAILGAGAKAATQAQPVGSQRGAETVGIGVHWGASAV